jgi:hypothetical protein
MFSLLADGRNGHHLLFEVKNLEEKVLGGYIYIYIYIYVYNEKRWLVEELVVKRLREVWDRRLGALLLKVWMVVIAFRLRIQL